MASLKDEMLAEAKEDALQAAEEVQRKASQLASAASDKISEAVAPFSNVERNFEAAVRKSIRDQPAATLAITAAMGFVLGALWKS